MIKKSMFYIILLIFIAIIFSSCDSNNKEQVIKKDEKVIIGFLMDTLKEERWQRDRDIFVAESEKLGAEVLVIAANGDDEKQIEQAKYLLNKGVDILVVVPHDAVVAKKIVEMAHRVNVKVVAYDRMIEGDVDYYISFDNEKVGELQGNYLVEKLKITEGNVVYIGGANTDNNAHQFRDGAISVLDNYDKINILYDEYTDDWKTSVAREHMESVLNTTDEKIDAVICANDAIAGSIYSLFAEKKMKSILIGQDAEISACQRIVEGKQTMTVYKDVRLLAKNAAKMVIDIVNNKEINVTQVIQNDFKDVESILLEPIVVDKDNMMELIIKSGFHKSSDVYRNTNPDDRPND
ncbi:substrate-binding domain-containing protein [Clostridiaceae bacterium HSG29]|nr:substrate-binding domain-containing protein [Clostridiaceae bacterium HSG29]